jgi:hypothetical protein
VTYPLVPGGVHDYPVKVGSMLLTLVDPHRGFEAAYNRWYERDHYYDGCMVGPFMFAGSRWVATRELKDLRWPAGNSVASPTDAGSYVAIYWAEAGHHEEHFNQWAPQNVRELYANGRGFAERTHVHTVVQNHIGAIYRDSDPVPVELALDHGYAAIVVLWFDAANGDAASLHAHLANEVYPSVIAGSSIEIVSSWTPSDPVGQERDVPMALGTPGGGPGRLTQICFLDGDVRAEFARLRDMAEQVGSSAVAKPLLVAPFIRTVVGTDRYVDEIW